MIAESQRRFARDVRFADRDGRLGALESTETAMILKSASETGHNTQTGVGTQAAG
jgi:hypothetical protein